MNSPVKVQSKMGLVRWFKVVWDGFWKEWTERREKIERGGAKREKKKLKMREL